MIEDLKNRKTDRENRTDKERTKTIYLFPFCLLVFFIPVLRFFPGFLFGHNWVTFCEGEKEELVSGLAPFRPTMLLGKCAELNLEMYEGAC